MTIDPGELESRPPSIEEQAFLSDCHTAALVSRTGSVDWYCTPRFDSPSVFGRLLDPDAGHWAISPSHPFEVERHYVGDSLVLRTEFRTDAGAVALHEGLAFEPGQRGHDLGLRTPGLLVRELEGLEGEVPVRVTFRPRFEFGLSAPHFSAPHGGGWLDAVAGPLRLLLHAEADWRIREGRAQCDVRLRAGERRRFLLQAASSFEEPPPPPGAEVDLLADAVEAWESWLEAHSQYEGRRRSAVRRSALVLQGLTHRATGAIVAAPTTSLPEVVGGDMNWDYRHAWLRDLSLTTRALWVGACPDEAHELFDFIVRAMGDLESEPVQILFGLDGRRDLTEHHLEHLAGYRESRPVRTGNDAWKQRQMDVLGEVIDAIHLLREPLGELSADLRRLIVHLADRAAREWHEPGAGMWEARDAERHYTSSKVLLWLALDRATDMARQLGVDDTRHWQAAARELRAAILDRAWSAEAGAYAGAFDSDRLDASVLLMPIVGFLPADDVRMAATIRRIDEQLADGPLVRRWQGDSNGFLLCSFWLVECLAMLGDVDEAERRFEELVGLANDVGLLAEMADPRSGEPLGNFPQALSHIGLVNAAWRLDRIASQAGVAGAPDARP